MFFSLGAVISRYVCIGLVIVSDMLPLRGASVRMPIGCFLLRDGLIPWYYT
jgi:hypothetical protein